MDYLYADLELSACRLIDVFVKDFGEVKMMVFRGHQEVDLLVWFRFFVATQNNWRWREALLISSSTMN